MPVPDTTTVLDRPGLAQSSVRRERLIDAGLSALLALQGLTLFVVLPLGGGTLRGRVLLDVCHLSFAVICIGVLTQRRSVRAALLATLLLLVLGPSIADRIGANLALGPAVQHELIALIAFTFNAVVTALVARHVFGAGRVTAHRIRGAVLLYLNVAALFAIAYGAIAMVDPAAFAWAASAAPSSIGAHSTDSFSYFSLATITTTGYGDVVPAHALARSLANLEAVFGQLFPATLLSRLVALHLAHERREGAGKDQVEIAPKP